MDTTPRGLPPFSVTPGLQKSREFPEPPGFVCSLKQQAAHVDDAMPGLKDKINHLRVGVEQPDEHAVHRIDAVKDAVPRPEPELRHHLHVAASYVYVVFLRHTSAF